MIRNESDKLFRIKSAQLALPAAIIACEAASNVSITTKPENCAQGIAGNQSGQCVFQVPSCATFNPFLLLNPPIVFFYPGHYRIGAVVEYREDLPDKPWLKESVETETAFEPPISSLVAGSLLGVVLVTLFVGANRARSVVSSEGLANVTFRRVCTFVVQLAFSALLGAIVAIIAVVMLQRVSGFSLPITIEVKDFIGAMIIGLFSVQLGRTLYERLSAP